MTNQDEKVNWVSVLNFLEKEYSHTSIREREWNYEKEVLTSRISTLEAELRSNAIICQDLVNRIKILQLALKEEKSKRASGKAFLDGQEVAALLDKFKLTKQLEKRTHEDFLKDITKDLKFLQEEPPKYVDETRENPYPNINNQRKITEKRKFGAHLDVVTAVVPLENAVDPLFATASEDCLIKVWSLATVLKEESPEPVCTLRKHTGPLFSLAGGANPHNKSEQLLFSGGIEGDIKSWRVDRPTAEWTGSWLNGSDEEQTIWELHMREDKLISSSSDGYARLFKIAHTPKLELTMLRQYKEKQFSHAAVKLISDQFFLASCSTAPRLHLWDVEGRLSQKYLYESEKGKDFSQVQANKIEVNRELKLVFGGCEDGFLRVFDYSSTKVVKKLETRTSITSLLAWEWEIAAGDHRGALHVWDSRMFKLLETRENLHLQKYETGLTSIAKINQHILTSGADGIVKIFN